VNRLISKLTDVDPCNADNWLSKYIHLKALFPESLVFVEVGDFFEVYLDDSKIVAKELELVLTGKKHKGDRISMAGLPNHSIDRYVRELKNKGFFTYLHYQKSKVFA
jgi:DNA mismatch repair protein MutS